MEVKVKGSSVTITAAEGCWVTSWTEQRDIVTFTAYKKITGPRSQRNAWHEITDAQYNEYMERKAVEEAARAEESTNEQEGEPMP